MNSKSKRALVLLSGGLDSTTCLYIAKQQNYDEIHTLSFNYSQKHQIELEFSNKIVALNNIVFHYEIVLNLNILNSSALTSALAVPKNNPHLNKPNQIPITYVPARNLIFLSIATSIAEDKNIEDIFIGVNQLDYSGYPDCRLDFIQSFQTTAALSSKVGREGNPVKILTPLINSSKEEIIRQGLNLKVPYEYTWSCYDPINTQQPCKECDACLLRTEAFKKLNLIDPLYTSEP